MLAAFEAEHRSEQLRTEPTLVGKAWLNILAHSAGAAHSKLALVGPPHAS